MGSDTPNTAFGTRDDVIERAVGIMSDHLCYPEESILNQLDVALAGEADGWNADSLDLIEVAMQLEEHFGIEMQEPKEVSDGTPRYFINQVLNSLNMDALDA